MKYYYFHHEIKPETTEKFLEFIQSNDGEITVFLNSPGGDDFDTFLLEKILNDNKDRITLIANGMIYSNAFRLFFKVNCKREIYPYTVGMFHQSGANRRICENGKLNYNEDMATQEAFKRKYKDSLKFCEKLGFTKAEMKKFKANDDVFFQEDRLREFLQK